MFNKIKATKNFVVDHKVAIAVTATSLVWFSLVRHNLKTYDTFLKEHDLYDTFWSYSEEV